MVNILLAQETGKDKGVTEEEKMGVRFQLPRNGEGYSVHSLDVVDR